MSRVLFIITQSKIGGAQRFLLEFAPYLVSRGHQVSVVAGEGDSELFEKLELRIKYQVLSIKYTPYKLKELVRKLNPVKDFLALISLLKIIAKEKPNIVFLQSTKAGFLGSLAVKLYIILNTKYKIQVIYRIGGWAFNDPRPWWMNQVVFGMEKISARWKDVIIVNSECDRQLAIQKKIAPAEKIVKIYNGIDPEKLNFLPKEKARDFFARSLPLKVRGRPACRQGRAGGGSYDNDEGVILIGTIANLYATKGISYFVEAAYILDTKYKIQNTKYIVLGEGPERPRLEALIKKHNLQDKFFLIGRVPNAAQYLKAFDIFVLPSVKEGFPWVLLEAMAAEVPMVATKVGAVPEIIEDGKNGLLVPSQDSRALSEKIQQFLAPPTSQMAHDRGAFATSAKEKLRQFTLQKMLGETYATLKL